jgi:putative ABC transport system ATP-binding protein
MGILIMPSKLPTESVVFKKVSKIYHSNSIEVRALENVSFTLYRGEFVAIIGPSGSGKSTLMHILGTIDKPTSGEIYIDGIATSQMKGDQLAEFRNKKLGFVFQSYNLINGLSAQENVELPLLVGKSTEADRRTSSVSLLTQLGLSERLHLKPNQLSGGQQQRVAVARALVNKPTLILADEPTGNLDTKSKEEVMKLLKSICRETHVTIVMVTHDPETTKHCDRVIYIKDGRLEKNEVM